MTVSKLSLELRNKIVEIAGREAGKEIVDLIMKYGIDVITELGSASAKLPGIEIETINPRPGLPGQMEMARRHQFICKINGKSLDPMLQRVELDPFDYGDPQKLTARITLIPIVGNFPAFKDGDDA